MWTPMDRSLRTYLFWWADVKLGLGTPNLILPYRMTYFAVIQDDQR